MHDAHYAVGGHTYWVRPGTSRLAVHERTTAQRLCFGREHTIRPVGTVDVAADSARLTQVNVDVQWALPVRRASRIDWILTYPEITTLTVAITLGARGLPVRPPARAGTRPPG